MKAITQVSASDARNRWTKLLDAVGAGETIELVRRGKPVARLVPVRAHNERFASPSEAAGWLRVNRAKISGIDGDELRALRDKRRH